MADQDRGAWSGPGLIQFPTPVGRCAVVWTDAGIAALQLPAADDAQTREAARRRVPDAREMPPPEGVRRALAAVDALLRGEAPDLTAIPLDLRDLPPFHRRVYEAARAIPPGRTLSYGGLAARLGTPGAARAVGQALAHNPCALLVPCHRVVAAGGRTGGFSAPGGVATKRRLLALEGAPPRGGSEAVFTAGTPAGRI